MAWTEPLLLWRARACQTPVRGVVSVPAFALALTSGLGGSASPSATLARRGRESTHRQLAKHGQAAL
eukprot:14796590-Alexandrium_andersonii.AAC.1